MSQPSNQQAAPSAKKPEPKKEGKDSKQTNEQKQQAPEIPVIRNENFNLDEHVGAYAGFTRTKRLLFVGERCPDVQVKAFRLAIEELKKGANSSLYLDAVSRAREVLGDKLGDEYGLDNNWLKNVNRQTTEQQTRLEVELNNQKRDQERDPTRRAYEALGNFFMQRGDFTAALTNYTTMKDYCANNRQTLEMCMQVIRASIHAGTLSYVNTHGGRAKSLPDIDAVSRAQVNAALGLYSLKTGAYGAAAERFLEVTTDMDGKYKDVMSCRDAAIYGSLCVLATYNRHELKNKVLNNSDFKKMLELAPGWRQIVTNFHQSNYSQVFAALEKLKNDLYLDMYVSSHVDKLFSRIRDRALVTYFRPFVSVKIPLMAQAFKMEPAALERQLVHLIGEGQIQARIDSANKILYARHADQRTATFQQALSVGTKYARDTKCLLLRMSLVEHQFVVKPSERRRRDDDEKKENDP
jgi:COP9 signalosome complex subunit 1